MSGTRLLISSKNYSSWSLRGFLLARLSGLEFEERVADPEDPANRRELLMQASSIRVPALMHGDVVVWDTLAIAEYLNETFPDAQMLPADKIARARCRSISGEMHSGFTALRESLPMNLRLFRPGFVLWSQVQADIDHIRGIWRDCLTTWKGPWLFGQKPTIADCFYAPVVTRFRSYDVKMEGLCEKYCQTIMAWPDMREWFAAAQHEPEQIDELDVEF
ncbi:MAG TPA: glutathione S-transferase family protein [Rhodopila sp.]|jgi:glutathione S-transferase|nr:glutathione S-transferase family protein [Rhodopila sp.]